MILNKKKISPTLDFDEVLGVDHDDQSNDKGRVKVEIKKYFISRHIDS